MQRSATCMNRVMTHSRSSPDLRMAFFCASAVSSLMRSATAWLKFLHVEDSQSRAVRTLTVLFEASKASSTDMPMARPRQYASCSTVKPLIVRRGRLSLRVPFGSPLAAGFFFGDSASAISA